VKAVQKVPADCGGINLWKRRYASAAMNDYTEDITSTGKMYNGANVGQL